MWSLINNTASCRKVTAFNSRYLGDAGPYPVFQRRGWHDAFARTNAYGERETTLNRDLIAVEPLTGSTTISGVTTVTIDRLDVSFVRWVGDHPHFDGVIYWVEPIVFVLGQETPEVLKQFDSLVSETIIPKLATLERRMRSHCQD